MPKKKNKGRAKKEANAEASEKEGTEQTGAVHTSEGRVEHGQTHASEQSRSASSEPRLDEPASTHTPRNEDGDDDVDPSARPGTPPEEEPFVKHRRKTDVLATRPGFGISGVPIKLIVNYFTLRFRTDFTIYHYDVDIIFLQKRSNDGAAGETRFENLRRGFSAMGMGRTAKEDAEKGATHIEHQQKRAPGKKRCRMIIAELVRTKSLQQYNPFYDGQKNLYTTKPLNITRAENFLVTLIETDAFYEFQVIVQPVEKYSGTSNIIDLEPLREVLSGRSRELPQEIIMALDTMMGHRFPPFEQIQVGRSFFMLHQHPDDLGEGAHLWYGYYQSIRLTRRGPVAIVDFAGKVFHKPGPMIDYLVEFISAKLKRKNIDITKFQIDHKMLRAINERIKGIKITRRIPAHMSAPLKVGELTKKTAKEIRFSWNGQDTNVADYYRGKYEYTLKYPNLPCVRIDKANAIFIPIEVCNVLEHQPILGTLSGSLTREVIKKLAIPPRKRFSKIHDCVQQIEQTSGQVMRQVGAQMELDPMRVSGRVLEKPMLSYHTEPGSSPRTAIPNETGKWNMGNNHFCKSHPGECKWILFSYSNRVSVEKLQSCANALLNCAREKGLKLQPVSAIKRIENVEHALRLAKHHDMDFAVIVLPGEKSDCSAYSVIKFVADIELGLVTQCIKDSVVENFKYTTVSNIVLKLNMKLGGSNHGLYQRPRFFTKPMIVFGADATHSIFDPSIAAVVGSLDAYPSRYAVTCRIQENPKDGKVSQEIILALEEMCKPILRRFIDVTRGKRPERILFFRDGVSEGEFNTVLLEEIPRIRRACEVVLDGFIPPITYIVVQKRHKTRFRAEKSEEGVGRMENIPPGTVVDKDVSHPIFYDFFLCSHEGIQGTSKPAHYVVIQDENGFSVDELQKVCYHLCYTYSRCNRSISIPPPVFYADLACRRAKLYAEYCRENDPNGDNLRSKGLYPVDAKRAINEVMGTLDNTMFYV